ncbi:MAG: hypothetical protein ACLR4W_08040, partial [Oscillospiraceae bacterium]
YAPFLKYLWLCINLVCSIPEAALKFSRESAGKVSQIRHSACVIQGTPTRQPTDGCSFQSIVGLNLPAPASAKT